MLPTSVKKNELAALVKSLQRTEKAFYKKMAKRHASANQALHLQLFELIDKYPESDEKFFQQQLKIKSASHLSSLKNYLWEDLLNTLVFLKRKNPLVQLHNLEAQVDILLSKNLTDSAEKLLSDAWVLATHLNLYTEQQKILKHRFILLFYAGIKHFESESSILLSLQQEVLRKIHQEQYMRMCLRELVAIRQFTYLHLSEKQLTQVSKMVQSVEKMQLEPNDVFLLLSKELTLSMAYHLSYQFPESNHHALETLGIWKAEPQLIQPNQSLFLISIDYALYNAFAMGDLDTAAYFLDTYGNIAMQHMDTKERYKWELISFNTRLKIHHKKADYEAVKKIMDLEANYVLEIVRNRTAQSQAITIMCSCLISYFVLGEFKKSEDLLMDVKDLNLIAGRDDVMYFITIFHMILLYEMKNDLQLHLAINASYAKLYHQNKLHPFEKDLMLFFKHLTNHPERKNRIHAIQDFIIKLEGYKNDAVKQLYFLYFNFYDWLQSKALKIPYVEYKKQLVNPPTLSDSEQGRKSNKTSL